MSITLNSKRRKTFDVPGYEAASVDRIRQEQRDAINAALASHAYPIVLAGTTGSGKTMAAACLYRRISEVMQTRPMWHRADDLLSGMALGQISGVQTDVIDASGKWVRETQKLSVLVNKLTNSEAVFLDDFGLESPKRGMLTQMFLLLERRLGKKLIITTNKTAQQIAELYDDRIVDRMRAGTTIVFKGHSRRHAGTAGSTK